MDGATIRDFATEAIKYWEPRRVLYNLVLAAIVAFYFFRSGFYKLPVSFDGFLLLVLLCVLANVAYCAAYIVDVFAQVSGFRERWRSLRWVLFSIGLLFAAILTRFWAKGLFGVGY